MDKNLIENLQKRHFTVHEAATGEEAKKIALDIIGSRSTGIGGSKTVSQLGLYETLTEQGNEVHWHWKVGPEKKKEERDLAVKCEVYMCSANALMEDGRIVQIDGTGNRLAGLIYGPPCVILIVGRQKIVPDYDSAIERIKRDTCPGNARRQNFDTPCAKTGVCMDCRGPARMCNVTAIIEAPLRVHKEFHVVLVDEELGL